MSVVIPEEPEKITGIQLTEVYKLFCKAYNIQYLEEFDGTFMRSTGIQELRTSRGMCYKACLGLRFLGKRKGHQTSFSGDAGLTTNENEKSFERLVNENLEKINVSSHNKTSSEYQHQMM